MHFQPAEHLNYQHMFLTQTLNDACDPRKNDYVGAAMMPQYDMSWTASENHICIYLKILIEIKLEKSIKHALTE
jgi:hypothetical protein